MNGSNSMAHLEHIFSLINAKKLEDHLEAYMKAGFVVSPQTVRHPPGLRNGFAYIGCEYIEFEWVENVRKYKKGKKAYHDVFRKHPAPFGFGFEEPNIEAFHERLEKNGIKIPKIYSRGPSDAKKGDAPWWSFQDLAAKLLPGVFPFVLRYEKRDYTKGRNAYCGPNKIFALSGVTFVTKTPQKDAVAWCEILSPRAKPHKVDGSIQVPIGPHRMEWLTAKAFEKKYGRKPYMPPSGRFASLRKTGLLHVLSDDLETTRKVLSRAGRTVTEVEVDGQHCLYVEPIKSDGFTFLIREYSLAKWKKERATLGQKCVVVSSRG